MANPKEGYLILTIPTYSGIEHLYPHAMSVTEDYKLVSYTLTKEKDMLSRVGNSEIVKLDVVGTIYAMDNFDYDGYICYAADIHEVLDAFIEEPVK